jgi:hypothetical protein
LEGFAQILPNDSIFAVGFEAGCHYVVEDDLELYCCGILEQRHGTV